MVKHLLGTPRTQSLTSVQLAASPEPPPDRNRAFLVTRTDMGVELPNWEYAYGEPS